MRGRTPSDRAKTPAEESAVAGVPAASQPPAAQATAASTGANVEKCVNCQYYDRRRARPTDGKAPMWGQCRRHAPLLNPATAKAYMVEGVWPLVRDDDWCGEYEILTRVVEDWIPESAPTVTGEADSQSHPADAVAASAGSD